MLVIANNFLPLKIIWDVLLHCFWWSFGCGGVEDKDNLISYDGSRVADTMDLFPASPQLRLTQEAGGRWGGTTLGNWETGFENWDQKTGFYDFTPCQISSENCFHISIWHLNEQANQSRAHILHTIERPIVRMWHQTTPWLTSQTATLGDFHGYNFAWFGWLSR